MIGQSASMDAEERELLARTLSAAVAAAVGEPEAGASEAALDDALAQIGWHHALVDDPRTAISVLFGLQGRGGVTSAALDAVLALGLAGGHMDGDALAGVAVVLPVVSGAECLPPGRTSSIGVEVAGLGTMALRRAEGAWVACDGSVVSVTADALERRSVHGLDPSLGLLEVSGDVAAEELSLVGGSWDEAVRLGRLALAHELVGASRAMVDHARDHAVERIQFGRPIAQFQAVRHRLAEAFVAVEAAEAAVEAGWDDGTVTAAVAAKAVAGRSAQVAAGHAQQVLAGIGFTTEHPLHLYVRRSLVLDGLLGDTRSLTRALGEQLLATRELPPLLPL